MSSPNHSTSDLEDAFSSMNILNYTLVSPDYFPPLAGSNSLNSSENSPDNMIPPVFSSLYNNPYLKNVQSFYAKEFPISSPDPITPSSILTPFLVLPPSLLFNPRYFFIPKELLLHRKPIHFPSSSSTTLFNSSRNQTCNLVSPSSSVYTSIPLQVFEIGKCSDKMYLKHHEKQVEDILHYLDKLYLYRIERMEEGRINGNLLKDQTQGNSMPPKRTSTSETPAITLDAIRQLINDGISSALKAQAAAMANSDNSNRNTEPREIPCAEEDKVTFATVKKMEDEFYNLAIKGNDLKTYIRRFKELATLCLNMVPNIEKRMEVFISGLPRSIEGNVTASKPQTLEEAINISQRKDIMRISAQKQITGPQESILKDELAFVHFRISTLETTLEDIQLSSESSSI
ncbi:hypothetical protein Tco_0816204 [Tanacetum coccineum]